MCECSRIRRCASGSGSWKKRHLQTRHSYCDIAYGRRTKQLGQPGFVAEREEREIGAHVFRERRAGVDSRRSKRRERGKGCRWTRRMVCARNVASLRPTRVYVISRVGYTRTDRQLRQHLYAGGGGNCPPAAAQNLAVAREAPLAAGWSQGRVDGSGRDGLYLSVSPTTNWYTGGGSLYSRGALRRLLESHGANQPDGRTDGRRLHPRHAVAPPRSCAHTHARFWCAGADLASWQEQITSNTVARQLPGYPGRGCPRYSRTRRNRPADDCGLPRRIGRAGSANGCESGGFIALPRC